MAESLAQYVQRVRGQYIDVDRAFGAQCWDQWSHYATNFLGVPSWPTYTNAGGVSPHSGWACNVYHNARAAGLEKYFEVLPASATPRAGDVAFWELGSAWYPWSHVATVLAAPMKGGMIRCLTQNPGAVQIADLVMRGIIGYLRPRKLNTGKVNTSKTPTLTASHKAGVLVRRNRRRNNMLLFVYLANGAGKQGHQYAVYEHGKPGSWWEFNGGGSANQLATQLGNAMALSKNTWNERKAKHS